MQQGETLTQSNLKLFAEFHIYKIQKLYTNLQELLDNFFNFSICKKQTFLSWLK